MIELILVASIAATAPPPMPPVIPPTPKPIYTPPSPPPTQSWSDKMWRRYKDNQK